MRRSAGPATKHHCDRGAVAPGAAIAGTRRRALVAATRMNSCDCQAAGGLGLPAAAFERAAALAGRNASSIAAQRRDDGRESF
jgi:hypothetical protein